MENIQVALRIRPLNRSEALRNDESIWATQDHKNVALVNQMHKDSAITKKIASGVKTSYTFDHCFSPENDNASVYERMVKRIALSSLNGINGTIFMYGQTGSGKTYTMMGYNKGEETDIENLNSCSESPMGKMSPKKNLGFSERIQAEVESQENFESHAENAQQENISPSHQIPLRSYNVQDISQNTGILILALKDIFQAIENDLEKTYFLKCSYVEIYNDQIYDLLKTQDKMAETLVVNEDPKKDFYIKGVTEEFVSSIEEILEKLEKGEANRHYARTMMNHTSSRSHTIFRLMVQTLTNNFIREYRLEKRQQLSNINNPELKNQIEQAFRVKSDVQRSIVTESLLNFVDLAGSEKVSNHHLIPEENFISTNSHGGTYKDSIQASTKIRERIKEGQHINKSLFFLTQVISLKSEGKSGQHIPYRNSPLTKILRSSLGGNSRTLVILCVTPAYSQFDQTVSTFRFGMNAKKIENRVQANIVTNDDNEVFKILIADYERKIRDYEIARSEEHARYLGLLRYIEDLQMQKAALIQKINNLMKLQLIKMSHTMPKDDLAYFFKQVRERLVHFDGVGILFTAKALKKYGGAPTTKQDGSVIRKRKKENRKRNRNRTNQGSLSELTCESSSSDEEFEEEGVVSKGSPKSIGNTGKVKDMVNQFSMAGLKRAKTQIVLLQKKVEALEGNFSGLSKRNLENYEKYLNMTGECDVIKKKLVEECNTVKQRLRGKCKLAKNKIQDLVEQYKKQLRNIVQMKVQLDLYKDMQGLEDLNDEELAKMESHLWTKIDEVKTEKARRVVEKESGVILPRKSKKKIEKESEVIDIVVPLDDIETCESSESDEETVNIGVSKQEQIKKESEEFSTLFKNGVGQIEQEIESAKKITVEMETGSHQKEKEMKEARIIRNWGDLNRHYSHRSYDMSSRNRGKDVNRSLEKREQKLDFAENLGEFKIVIEMPKLKSLNELDFSRSKLMGELGFNSHRKDQRNRQEREVNTQGSLDLETKEEMEVLLEDKGEKTRDFLSRDDLEEILLRSESSLMVSRYAKEPSVTREDLMKDVGLYKGGKVGPNTNNVMSIKSILNNNNNKGAPAAPATTQKPGLMKSKTMMVEQPKEKPRGMKSPVKGETAKLNRMASMERIDLKNKEKDKEILSMSRRNSITKKEDITQTYREEEKDVKGKNDPSVLTTRKSPDKFQKAKSVEKMPKKKKEEDLLKRQPEKKATIKSKESPKGPKVEKSSKIQKLKLLLSDTEETVEKHQYIESTAQNLHQIPDQSQNGIKEASKRAKTLSMGDEIGLKTSPTEKTLHVEESKIMPIHLGYSPKLTVTIDEDDDLIEKHYLCYSGFAEDSDTKEKKYYIFGKEKESGQLVNAALLGSPSSTINRLEAELNRSDTPSSASAAEEYRKRRTREERKKSRLFGVDTEGKSLLDTLSPKQQQQQ